YRSRRDKIDRGLQFLQLGDYIRWNQIGASAEQLSQLDKSGAQFLDGQTDSLRNVYFRYFTFAFQYPPFNVDTLPHMHLTQRFAKTVFCQNVYHMLKPPDTVEGNPRGSYTGHNFSLPGRIIVSAFPRRR